MKVKLLAYTPEPEKTVACAAKLCYAAADIDTVYEGLTEEKTVLLFGNAQLHRT